MTAGRWIEVADRVFGRRYGELDLTVGLVVGEHRCLVIDARGDADQGAELAAAIRELTPLPWSVALTHDHFDHAHGLPAFLPCEAWADPGCWRALADDGRPAPEGGRCVSERAELDLGGRRVVLLGLGAAHSPGDLAVFVPDVDVLFAGDVVEHVPGGSFSTESFGPDTVLARWPTALARLLDLGPATVLPGHGEPVGPDFVRHCYDVLHRLVLLRRAVGTGELTRPEAAASSPLPPDVTLAALTEPVG